MGRCVLPSSNNNNVMIIILQLILFCHPYIKAIGKRYEKDMGTCFALLIIVEIF
jgi:hypothetical protein